MRLNKKNLILFMPYIDRGGVEKNLFLIANYLSKKISNIKICTLSFNKKKFFDKKIKFLSPPIQISEKFNIKIRYFLCLYTLFKFLLENRNSVVLAFQANVYCVLLCKILNIKVIIRANSSPSGWNHNFIKKYVYKKIVSKADIIIVNSLQFQSQMWSELELKTKCIYNPLNISDLKKMSKKGKKDSFFKNNNTLKLVNIGRFTEQKDQITILRAINNLKKELNFRLIIIGYGDSKQKLVNFIKKNHLSKSVKINDTITNPYGILDQSDVFILSSKFEGLPNVLLEAAALKKFIISTKCPCGPKEILLDGKGGLFFKIGNYKDLSSKILIYSKNKKKLSKKIQTTFQNLHKYDYDKNLKKYYDLISRLI
tara:strand:+ start:12149 stop:13255 length:1107 start_codon:yes stop_codon:yes gene_type:complete